jgi:hypothetical protein
VTFASCFVVGNVFGGLSPFLHLSFSNQCLLQHSLESECRGSRMTSSLFELFSNVRHVHMTKCHWTYGQMFLAITVVSDRINSEQDRTTFRIDSTTRLYF